jgi:hypothetical protein
VSEFGFVEDFVSRLRGWLTLRVSSINIVTSNINTKTVLANLEIQILIVTQILRRRSAHRLLPAEIAMTLLLVAGAIENHVRACSGVASSR